METPLGLRDRAILELLYATGIRNEELRTLELVGRGPGEGSSSRVTGKGSEGARRPRGTDRPQLAHGVPARQCRPLLVSGRDPGTLFLSKSGRRITTANLIDLVRKYAKKAGLSGRRSRPTRCATPAPRTC